MRKIVPATARFQARRGIRRWDSGRPFRSPSTASHFEGRDRCLAPVRTCSCDLSLSRADGRRRARAPWRREGKPAGKRDGRAARLRHASSIPDGRAGTGPTGGSRARLARRPDRPGEDPNRPSARVRGQCRERPVPGGGHARAGDRGHGATSRPGRTFRPDAPDRGSARGTGNACRGSRRTCRIGRSSLSSKRTACARPTFLPSLA